MLSRFITNIITTHFHPHHQGTDLEVVEGEVEVDEGSRQRADVGQSIDKVSLKLISKLVSSEPEIDIKARFK